jgi:hypothetical protein
VVCVVMNRGCAAWKGCSSRDFTQNAERAGVFSGPFFVRWYPLQVFAMQICRNRLRVTAMILLALPVARYFGFSAAGHRLA